MFPKEAVPAVPAVQGCTTCTTRAAPRQGSILLIDFEAGMPTTAGSDGPIDHQEGQRYSVTIRGARFVRVFAKHAG
jgi:hypothetical protein